MKKRIIGMTTVMFLCISFFVACPGGKETPSEKGTIEKMTEETGKELADTLSAPIDEARKVAEQGEDRLNDMMNAMEEQK